ncbi:2TM domain-containing protein [uncultured Maribacter sp.]|uniref:2TM domain-containing protein n=1 Tax=uncultured Maribacter sp. TaxID=431308 RepID=UPI00261D3ACE|nr:2TM domain-containing protein [uncultured Maribacter sp.]
MENQKLQLAKKKVKAVKHWYILIVFAILGTICLSWFRVYLINIGTPEKWSWLVMIGPVIWVFIILFKGLIIFNKLPRFFKNWEERQLKKILEDEENKIAKYK